MCGIAGFSGFSKKKTFNESFFRFLCMKQDKRGGDGCGIIAKIKKEDNSEKLEIVRRTNDKYKKEVALSRGGEIDLSEFRLLFELWELDPEKKLLSNFCSPFLILAHARKTSMGSTNLANTHPHQISRYNDKGEITSTLVGVHNGTVRDWCINKLSKKTGVDVKGITSDSRALFKMMASSDENLKTVLTEYSGAATLVWVDTRFPDEIFCWVGEEQSTTYRSKKGPERPLHYMETNDGIYISSLEEPLLDGILLNGFKFCRDFPVPFETDAITSIKNGKIKEIVKFKRNPVTVSSYYTSQQKLPLNYPSNRSYSNNNKNSSFLPKSKDTELKNQNVLPIDNKYSVTGKNIGRIYVKNGLYYYEEELLNDISPIFLTEQGFLLNKNSNGYCYAKGDKPYLGKKEDIKETYFYNGVLLTGKVGRDYINHKLTLTKDKKKISLSNLRKVSDIPLAIGTSSKSTKKVYLDHCNSKGLFTGIFFYPYTKQGVDIKQGKISKYVDLDEYNSLKIEEKNNSLDHLSDNHTESLICNDCKTKFYCENNYIQPCPNCFSNSINTKYGDKETYEEAFRSWASVVQDNS
jgi:hypothetical protein